MPIDLDDQSDEEVLLIRPDEGCRTRSACFKEVKIGDAFKLHEAWFYKGVEGIQRLSAPSDSVNG